MSEPRLVEVRRNVLKQNDVIARALREQFKSTCELATSYPQLAKKLGLPNQSYEDIFDPEDEWLAIFEDMKCGVVSQALDRHFKALSSIKLPVVCPTDHLPYRYMGKGTFTCGTHIIDRTCPTCGLSEGLTLRGTQLECQGCLGRFIRILVDETST